MNFKRKSLNKLLKHTNKIHKNTKKYNYYYNYNNKTTTQFQRERHYGRRCLNLRDLHRETRSADLTVNTAINLRYECYHYHHYHQFNTHECSKNNEIHDRTETIV